MEISISCPHDEHFIVGKKLDSRGKAMLVASSRPQSSLIRGGVVDICSLDEPEAEG